MEETQISYTIVRHRSAHGCLIGIFKSLGGWAFTRTLNLEGKKIEIFQSLGLGFWTSIGPLDGELR